MNRKKALIALLALQMMLQTILVVLFISDVISTTVFISLVIFVGAVFSAFTIAAVRKLPLE
jgi:hypothetical protein